MTLMDDEALLLGQVSGQVPAKTLWKYCLLLALETADSALDSSILTSANVSRALARGQVSDCGTVA